MIILRVLGILLGIVLGLFILLTGFTLWAPMRVEFRRKPPDGPIKLRGSFGPVKKVFTIGKRKKLPKQKAKQPQKEQKPKKEKQPQAPRFDVKKLDYGQAFSLLLTLIDDMAGAMTWDKLHVTLI